jgi:phage gp36-like protein
MAYCSADDVRAALAPSGEQPLGSGAEDNTPAMDDGIAQAQGLIDASLKGLYEVPFADPTPALVHFICRDLAAGYVYLAYLTGQDVDQTNPVLVRFNAARQNLADLAKGILVLVEVDPIAEDASGGVHNPIDARLWGPEDFGLRKQLAPVPKETTRGGWGWWGGD